MRSYLFVPADSERKLAKALAAGADCLILDLEDSVSLGRKAVARDIAAAFLRSTREVSGRPMLMVRVNALSTGLAEEDLAGVMPGVPDAVLLPKSGGGADVQQLAVMLAVHEAENGIDQEQTAIHALVTETAAGVLNAGTYAGKTDRLKALAWGGEDLAADIGAASNRNAEGIYTDVFSLARSLTLLGAAAAGVDAVDTVYTDFRDEAGLAEECAAAARDGFSGKMAIHPSQVPIINRAFTPSDEAVGWARRVVALFEEVGADAGVLSLDGVMIDRPHLRQAERILARLSPAARG
jgi:citrate lyase subunit beta/citryl-CoA lyase